MQFALVDCNSFYCSCERVFNPKLRDQPVIVLSNNDGCVVARTNEVKALGIPMGIPLFKIQHLIKPHGIYAFSSNYTLYGDMSERVMQSLAQFTPNLEIYSIDEAFLDLSNLRQLTDYATRIRKTVRQWTGIPTSVGIGCTKTLAKLANRIAKKLPEGVFNLNDHSDPDPFLAKIEVEDIWGVGSRWGRRLREHGIETALQLREADQRLIKQEFGVVMMRIVLELQGVSCLPLEMVPPDKKGICVSRSFGCPVESLRDLQESVALYVTRAGEKLRRGGLCAQVMSVFAHTNRFRPEPQIHLSRQQTLPVPTDDTNELLAYALACVKAFYQPGIRYQKTGVLLTELIPRQERQLGLFDCRDREKHQRLMEAIDRINQKMGSGTIYPAASGILRPWQLRAELKSPRYTTSFDELPVAKVG